MHMTSSGAWEADARVGCLNQPKDILDYCKKVNILMFMFKIADLLNFNDFMSHSIILSHLSIFFMHGLSCV